MSEPMLYPFAPEDIEVVVHLEGTAYAFSKNGAPLNSAIDDLDAQVQS